MDQFRDVTSDIWLGGGGELKSLGPLPFGGPLKKLFKKMLTKLVSLHFPLSTPPSSSGAGSIDNSHYRLILKLGKEMKK